MVAASGGQAQEIGLGVGAGCVARRVLTRHHHVQVGGQSATPRSPSTPAPRTSCRASALPTRSSSCRAGSTPAAWVSATAASPRLPSASAPTCVCARGALACSVTVGSVSTMPHSPLALLNRHSRTGGPRLHTASFSSTIPRSCPVRATRRCPSRRAAPSTAASGTRRATASAARRAHS